MSLHLVEAFHTIQGEGFHAGRRALFVRMPFCNLSCTWCDTSFNKFNVWTEEQFRSFCGSDPCRFAVVTGGEPTMHKHTTTVVSILREMGFTVAMESNGTRPLLFDVHFLTVSPKRFTTETHGVPYFVDPSAMRRASEFKYVVDDEFDFNILKRHDVGGGQRHYLSPEWGSRDRQIPRILGFLAVNTEWKISLQVHKVMGVP